MRSKPSLSSVAVPRRPQLSSGRTRRHSNHSRFLRGAEATKLLNCRHHLSASTDAVMNGSLESASGNQLKRKSPWMARAFCRRFPNNPFTDSLRSNLYTLGNSRSLTLNRFRKRFWHVNPRGEGKLKPRGCGKEVKEVYIRIQSSSPDVTSSTSYLQLVYCSV